MSAAAGVHADPQRALRWALLAGNFAIGCGVMVVAGTLNDLARSLQVPVPLAGQLIAIGAAVMATTAPLLAGWVGRMDRRRLLAAALLWFAAGHALAAAMPGWDALWPVRAACMLAAAVFTPQAAAAIGQLAPPAQRGRAITFVFLGWSLASVAGMPLSAWLGEQFGWRAAFGAVAAMSLAAAAGVWHTMPDGVRPAPLGARAWGEALRSPALMAVVGVTLLQSAGQFTLFSYFAPYFRQVLQAPAAQLPLAFAWFGAFGLLGNLLLSRHVDRLGAARAVLLTISLIASTMLLWPLAGSLVMLAPLLVPWALGCFAGNSAQQARLGGLAPALAPALMALNTSALYAGQALGAAGGGWVIAHGGYAPLSWIALAWMLAALALSVWAMRAARGGAVPVAR